MQTRKRIKQMSVTHDPDYNYHFLSFGYGGSDGITIACLDGETIRVTESHDGGTVGAQYDEVPLKEFLHGLGIETFTFTRDLAREWWE